MALVLSESLITYRALNYCHHDAICNTILLFDTQLAFVCLHRGESYLQAQHTAVATADGGCSARMGANEGTTRFEILRENKMRQVGTPTHVKIACMISAAAYVHGLLQLSGARLPAWEYIYKPLTGLWNRDIEFH